jgi:hypothetical protein
MEAFKDHGVPDENTKMGYLKESIRDACGA